MTDNTQELDVNKLEQIIADHNKEMRADMASEITGGTRSKSITDVITVKAILDWHNKQVEEVIKKPHILPKNAYHLESVKQGINFYHRQMRKRVDKLKESK